MMGERTYNAWMEKLSGIYALTCSCGDGVARHYIGQSIDIKRRFTQHRRALRYGRHANIKIQRHWNKYGEDAFSYHVLELCGWDELDETENWWLSELIGKKFSLNIGVDARSPFKGVSFTPEHRANMSLAQKGKKTGVPLTSAHRAAISLGGLGLKRSDETKVRIAKANAGTLNCMFGKSGISNMRSRPVIGFPVHGGEPICFASANLAKQAGFRPSEITHCCKGRHVTHKGYRWEYNEGQTEPASTLLRRHRPVRDAGGKFLRWERISENQEIPPV